MRGRGAEDLLLAVVDGLRSFPEAILEAILAVFPKVVVHFHLLRQGLGFVAYKDRRRRHHQRLLWTCGQLSVSAATRPIFRRGR